MYYKIKFEKINSLIEKVIKLYNKFYKLDIEIYYSNPNIKIGFYQKYISYYIRK